jgi:DNA-binding XRE family transcriptional regulator
VTRATLHYWETGKRNPSLEATFKLMVLAGMRNEEIYSILGKSLDQWRIACK